MVKKHFTLIGIIISLLLFLLSTLYYPGGSQKNKNSIGYDWKNNYPCNLFDEKAINGLDNASRLWAKFGMFFLCISFAVFFIRFSKRIPSKTSANIIKYSGAGSMLFAFLVITPYHDLMTTIASIFALITLFYISVFIFKSKLSFFKFLSIACLLVLYLNNYIYYSRNLLDVLPIMQKISFLLIIIWILGLEYFTKKLKRKIFNKTKLLKQLGGRSNEPLIGYCCNRG